MKKLNIVFSQFFFPVTIGRYLLEELKAREDTNIYTVGPASGTWIPWNGGMNLPAKYIASPDLSFPRNINKVQIQLIESRLPFVPDAWIQSDAGFHFEGKPKFGINIHMQTDPHCLMSWYNEQRKSFDLILNMQTPYLQEGDRYFPYAYSDKYFYPEEREKLWDACLIGLHYPQRDAFVNRLKKAGLKVYYDIGMAFHEYRDIYNSSKVAISWSSLQDTPMRVYEAFGMKVPLVANRTPDLLHQFTEGEEFLGFDHVAEAIQKVLNVITNYDKGKQMAEKAYKKAKADYTWKERAKWLVEEIMIQTL